MYLDLASVTMNTTISAPSTTPTASSRSQRARLAVLVTVLVAISNYAAVNWRRVPTGPPAGPSQRQAPQAMVSKLRLPPGFSASIFAQVPSARSLAVSPGTLPRCRPPAARTGYRAE